jgi:hypothetical protein
MIRSKRTKPRPGRLQGKALSTLRMECWVRDGGRCVKCYTKLHYEPRYDGDPNAYDMAHKRNRRMYGDSIGNVQAECHSCHMKGHSGEKPCPKK